MPVRDFVERRNLLRCILIPSSRMVNLAMLLNARSAISSSDVSRPDIDATRKLVGNQFAYSDLGEVGVSGFKTPVRVWRLDAELASA